ncbi:MAG: hypothetical protein ACLR6B_00540 [Blautia sp.]
MEKLIAYHDYRPEISERAVRRFLNKTGKELFPLILKVQRADIAAQSDYQRAEKEERLKEVELLAEKIFEEKQCFSLKDLAVSGRDLIDDGMEPGKQLGEVLSELLGEVLRDPAHNTKRISSGIFQNPSPELMLRLFLWRKIPPHNSRPVHIGIEGADQWEGSDE